MNKKTIDDIQVQGKKVLVRCDFNVPLDYISTLYYTIFVIKLLI